MAKIPLRAYTKEIDQMVDNGQTAEAAAHCKYILKLYPKHIDTYRLLGQAYLTDQRYTEAADILQRVLSVIPDDFISQIGMSIIREDEGNLDAAIYHMEKAFEVQPSKAAIQGELRRLYGRRDGMEPPKIRLTRGALVRMYMRGELYPQAIAEVRAALADDSQQIDLEVILARLYALSGQKVQAVEICSRLVARLPYCLEANRILAEVLPGTTRAEDAKVFQDRIRALDPYAAYLAEGSNDPASVPDAAVQLERLEYNAAAEESEQPEWTRAAGVAWEETGPAQVPSWLQDKEQPDAVEPEVRAEMSATATEPGAESAAPAVIPEWMAAAGWAPSSGETVETPAGISEEDATLDEGLAAPGEIPDWLQSLAPETESGEPATTTEEDEAWLKKIVGEEGPSTQSLAPQPVEDEIPTPVEETGVELPQGEALPDWLQQLKTEEPIAHPDAQPEAALADADAGEELPDWLKQMKTEEPIAQADAQPEAALADADAGEELPDWLQKLKTEESATLVEEAQTEATVAAAETAVELPEWLQDLQTEEPAAGLEAGAQAPAAEAAEALPDWLKEIQPEAAGEIEQQASPEELPDWLTPQTEAIGEPVSEAVAADELPGWLAEQAETTEASSEEALPDWIASSQTAPTEENEVLSAVGFEGVAPVGEASAPTQLEVEAPMPEAAIETADEMVGTPLETVEAAGEIQVEAPSAAAPLLSAEDDIDSALAWLESLAAKQGVDESELLTQPEQRSQQAPEWISRAEIEPAAADRIETEAAAGAPETIEPVAPALIEQPLAEIETIQTETGALEYPITVVESVVEEPISTPVEAVQTETEELEFELEEETPPTEAVISQMEAAEPAAQAEITAEDIRTVEGLFAEAEQTVDVNAPTQPVRVRAETSELPGQIETAAQVEIPEMEVDLPEIETPGISADVEELNIDKIEPTEEIALGENEAELELSAADLAEPEVERPATPQAVEPVPSMVEEAMPQDLDEALAWLEALAAKQGADEATLLTAPESRSETRPEWLDVEAAQQEPVAPAGEIEIETPAAEIPAETVDEAIGPVAELAEAEEPAAELPQIEEPAAAVEPAPEPQGWVLETEVAETAAAESIPEWLQDLEFAETGEAAAVGDETQKTESLPEWLQDLEAEPEEPVSALPAVGEWTPDDAAEETPAPEMELPAEAPTLMTEEPAQPLDEIAVPEEERTKPVPVPLAEPVTMEAPMPVAMTAGESGTLLEDARRALDHGEIETALERYAALTASGEQLEDIIHDLRDATYRFPMNTDIWQALGDAYRQGNHVQDALDAYTKAIELLR